MAFVLFKLWRGKTGEKSGRKWDSEIQEPKGGK
jgi:hypothetical protein